jgi:23S rRNA (guanosine2251-2'-O)-methyltransferase
MLKKGMDELQRLSTEEFHASHKSPIVVILENVRSMHNVGSVFRTCDAFRVEKICLCGYTPRPPHRDINKTALGATETVEWAGYEDGLTAVAQLKEQGYSVYTIEQVHNSISLESFNYQSGEKIALVFGNEAEGVSEELIAAADGCIEIPQFGSKHSFNISVAAGIVLWELCKSQAQQKIIDIRN